MAKENQLIKVVFRGNKKKYIFVAAKEIMEKDIVYCRTEGGTGLAIVTDVNVDVGSLLDNLVVACSLKKANFVCKSTHDLSSSKNMAIKALFDIHNVAMYELLSEYNYFQNNCIDSTLNDADLPY